MSMINVKVQFQSANNANAFNLAIPSSTTLGELKRMIQERSGLNMNEFNLIFRGSQLKNDSAPLSSYNIKTGSVVFAIQNVHGGK
jgi:hypothetical protein